jgi:hypothetical protein
MKRGMIVFLLSLLTDVCGAAQLTPERRQQLQELQAIVQNIPRPSAAWWTDVSLVARLGLTGDQQSKIEEIFEQSRQYIVLSKVDLEREEALLGRMLDAETMPPTPSILSQIDRVVAARGKMERTYAGMMLQMRQCLTRSQWVQLQKEAPQLIPPLAESEALRKKKK